MHEFELQTYQNGKWVYDSYYDDRDTVLSEAERLKESGRYAGIRVLQESYSEITGKSKCQVIFSRLDKNAGGNWREKAQKAQTVGEARSVGGEPGRRYARRRHSQARKSNPYVLMAIASVLVLAGIAAVIALREVAALS